MNSDLKLASMFTDHMVLQQNSEVPVWGVGAEGDVVTLSFQGQQHTTKVVDGGWKIQLSPLASGGPYEMLIESDRTRLDGD